MLYSAEDSLLGREQSTAGQTGRLSRGGARNDVHEGSSVDVQLYRKVTIPTSQSPSPVSTYITLTLTRAKLTSGYEFTRVCSFVSPSGTTEQVTDEFRECF